MANMLFAVFEYKGLCPDSVDGDCKSLPQFHRMAYPMERITKYCSKPLAGFAIFAGVKNLGRCTQTSLHSHNSLLIAHNSLLNPPQQRTIRRLSRGIHTDLCRARVII